MNPPRWRGQDDDWDSWWHGWATGHRQGFEVGQRYVDPRLIDERARELLHAEALRTEALAYAIGLRTHGQGWADLVRGEAS